MLVQEVILENFICHELEVIKGKKFHEIVTEIGWNKFHEIMHYMYSCLGMGTVPIGKLIGKSDVTVADWLRRLGIQVKSHKYKVYARLGEKQASKVEVKNSEQVITHMIVPDEDLVRLIFFTIGDGSVQSYMIHIHQAEKRMFPILRNRMMHYGTVFIDYYDFYGRRVDTLEEACVYRLTLNNAMLARLIADRQGLRLDTVQFCLKDRRLATYAIASLWDADGSLPQDKTKLLGFRAEITQSHIPEAGKDAIKFLTQVREALKNHWKINSRLRFFDVAPTTQIYKKLIKVSRPRYILHISQKDLPKFANELGIHCEHPNKKERSLKIIETAEILGLLNKLSLKETQPLISGGNPNAHSRSHP